MTNPLSSSCPDRVGTHKSVGLPLQAISHTGRLFAVGAFFSFAAASGQAAPAESPGPAQFIELFWALVLLVAFVSVAIIWMGIIRRNVRQQTETIRRREAALEEYYRELFENAHDILFTHTLDGQLSSLNTAGEQILGYSRQEAAGMNFAELIAPAHQDSFREVLDRLEEGLTSAHRELEVRAKDGHRVVLRINWRRQEFAGAPRVQGIAWDITERQQAEEALQESEQRLRRSLEQRVQLGRDLHDGIIQTLYAIGLGLQECRNLMTRNPSEAQGRLAGSIADLNTVIRDVRNFIVGLEPEALRGREFKAALQSLVGTMSQTHAAQFSFDIDAQAAEALNTREATNLLQIAREAMSNSLRHARAKNTVVSLKGQNGRVRLVVQDDGAGFEPGAASGRGHGLRNILARANELGARSEIVSRPSEGTRVVVEIPADRLDAQA